VVLSAGREEASEALEQLCRAYWYPVYAYIRRKGLPAEDARDATQGFFLSLLQSQSLRNASADKGRFRSFLVGAVNHYLADEHARATAAKRGGKTPPIELDALEAEERYRLEPAVLPTPEHLFDRRWALTTLERALRTLEVAYREDGRGPLFHALQGMLAADPAPGGYAKTAEALGMSEGAVKTAVHRLRRRYGECCREEVAKTVAEAGDVEEELRYLCEIMARCDARCQPTL
jgi:RNA polymerase sigma-70 factor (ECF subfamily)